jgi:signal peptidase I
MQNSRATAATKPTSGMVEAKDRSLFRRVLWITVPLALIVMVCTPNVGPVFRVYSSPSASMAPALPVGGRFFGLMPAYGYSRYSLQWFDLPISGRIPAWQPTYGDVITFRQPGDKRTVFVKRVVGLGGDRVQMVDGRLQINGTAVPRREVARLSDPDPTCSGKPVPTYVETMPNGVEVTILKIAGDKGDWNNTAVFVVPTGHLFVTGDNRDNSVDSRMPTGGIGFVPLDHVTGRVLGVK